MGKTANWTRENLAWLAGLIEGEGCFQYSQSKCLSIQVTMTDEDVLRRAHLVAGMGHVYGPRNNGPGRKDYWTWTVGKQADTYALTIALYQWLGKRRRDTIHETISRWLYWQRNKPPRPINRGRQKLTPAMLAEIRIQFGAGPNFRWGVRKRLAEKFGVSVSAIERAARREPS